MGSEQTVSLFVSNAHILYTRFELNSFSYKIRHKSCFESNTVEKTLYLSLEPITVGLWPWAVLKTHSTVFLNTDLLSGK